MHRINQNSKKTILKLALLFNFLLIALVACDVGTSTPRWEVTPWTPSPSATATCVPNMSLSTPEGWGETELIVILFDPRFQTIGDQYLELENKERIRDIPSFIDKIVPRLIKPGGQVSILQLGYSSYESARVARLYSYSTIPQLYNTPSPLETLTPIPSPVVSPEPGFEAVAATQAAKIQLTARAATETANEAEHSCQINYWNDVVQLTATAWNGTATAELNEAENNFATEVAKHDSGIGVAETPFRTNELYYGGVYYGLDFASTIFQAECKNYIKCTLIIIDDLQVWGKNNPDNLSINLNGVNVYAILPNCMDFNQTSCVELKKYWDAEFKEFGAGEVVYWNGIRAEINLLNAIGR